MSKIPSFGQCSSSIAGSLNPLLLSSKWMLAALPHHRECTNLHQSAYQDQNRYHARYPHHLQNIPPREELYANTYFRPANWWFQQVALRKCYQLRRVAYLAAVELALESPLCIGRVEVHLFLCVSSLSAVSLQCHFGKEGSRTFGFDEALPGVFIPQPSPCCAQDTQHPASVHLGPRRVVSSWDICILNCRARKAFFGHFGHIQRQAHVVLFQLYPTSLPCHSCRHVENLQDIRWCF